MKVLVLALVVLMLGPAAAHVDLLTSVNWARLHGCRPAAQLALRENSRLAAVALSVGGGLSLHAALVGAGYLASQSTALHLSGGSGDADISGLLTANYCRTLTDPKLLEVGVQRRGGDVWMVLAAPVWVPSAGDAASISREILQRVNVARSSARRCGGTRYAAAAALTQSSALTSAALAHSQDMAQFLEFEHRGHDGSSPSARVARAAYGEAQVVGENIAAGAMTPAEVTQGWLDSPAHCQNIMDPRFKEMGLGFAVNLHSPELIYWTQDFALARGAR